jgi:DSF synthase
MQDLKLATATHAVRAHVGNMNADAWPVPLPTWRPGAEGKGRLRHALNWRHRSPTWAAFAQTLSQLELGYDESKRVLWQYMLPTKRPSFTRELISDMSATLDFVESLWCDRKDIDQPVSFLVLASQLPGIFNLGGDLELFLRLIEAKDRESLSRYAHACIDGQHRISVNLNLPICTIALVQGDALGGGFEAALAHNVIVAEKSVKFGLPEVLFNLFPGMGAYSFLSRRLDAARAERMILSGRLYTAEEMYEMGVVDVLAEPGCGVEAVHQFVARYRRTNLSRQAMAKARQIVAPVTRDELMRITDLWVETALSLSASDLRKMRHLAEAQDRRWAKLHRNG